MIFSYIIAFLFTIRTTALLPEQRYPLDVSVLHNNQKNNKHIDAFPHTAAFFDAIHSGKKGFVITENKNTIENNEKSYDLLSKQAFYNSTVTVSFFDEHRYYSLDIADTDVESIDTNYIIDCAPDTVVIKPGDYYVGSSNSPHNGVKLHANHGSNVGFIFSRRVLSSYDVRIDAKKCRRVFTEIVHPLEMINTNIEMSVKFPYNRVVVPRHLEETYFATPDYPLLLCSDPEITDNEGIIHKTGSNTIKKSKIPIRYSYALDTNGNECIDAEAIMPGSINFNHASGANAIKPVIDLGYGLTCNNCYSFIGASVLVVFNIFGGKMSTFAFEAKLSGGAGYNLGLVLTNPSFSAAKYINLAGNGPVSSIPIVAGLSLDINFGGAWATVKGSGSAKGRASFSSGYTFFEEDRIMYAKSKWDNRHQLTNVNNLKPAYSISGFKLSSVSFTAIASVSARIHFSLGGSIPIVGAGASIDFSTILTATSQLVKYGSGKMPAMSFDVVETQNLRGLKSGESRTYYPGEKIPFFIDYTNLNPNENYELYFNIHQSATKGTGYPIKIHKFRTTHSGSGKIKTEWIVPHDSKFIGDNSTTFSLHCSCALDRHFTRTRVHLSHARNGEHSIVRHPYDGTVLPRVKRTVINWDKNGLKYFKHRPGTDGMGGDEVSKRVNLLLVVKDELGHSKAYQLANGINNTGLYTIAFPFFSAPFYGNKKYFVVIHDSDEYTKMSWQNGFFKFDSNMPHDIDAKMPKLIESYIESPILEDGTLLWGDSVNLHPLENSFERRQLLGPNTCRVASLSVLLQIEIGFDGFTLLGKHYTLGSTESSPFVIIPQTNFCIG